MRENSIPKWQRELRAFLGINSGIILEGNVYDEYPFWRDGQEITAREYKKVLQHTLALEFPHLFLQDKESADTSYIPVWDD